MQKPISETGSYLYIELKVEYDLGSIMDPNLLPWESEHLEANCLLKFLYKSNPESWVLGRKLTCRVIWIQNLLMVSLTKQSVCQSNLQCYNSEVGFFLITPPNTDWTNWGPLRFKSNLFLTVKVAKILKTCVEYFVIEICYLSKDDRTQFQYEYGKRNCRTAVLPNNRQKPLLVRHDL